MQPHAGANANLAADNALLKPGETVLAMQLDHGGHLTHGSPASITSKIWRFVSYGVSPAGDDDDKPGEVIDFDRVAEVAKAERPRMIVAGFDAYARTIDPLPFRKIADSVGALFDLEGRAGRSAMRSRTTKPTRPQWRPTTPTSGRWWVGRWPQVRPISASASAGPATGSPWRRTRSPGYGRP